MTQPEPPPATDPSTVDPGGSARPVVVDPGVVDPGAIDPAALAALEIPAVYAALRTSPGGLGAAEAAARLASFGPNEVPAPRRRPLAFLFIDQLTGFMAILLWVGGALAFASGTPALGIAIWAVILINAAFSFWQEYRAERALEELTSMLPSVARVIRDGTPVSVPARELVPGDVIALEEGDRISADARLVWSALLRVDLSVLTGESVPSARTADPVADVGEGHRAEVADLVFAGTTVATGRGTAVVHRTGAATEFGRVAHLTATVERDRSTLEIEVARTARIISILAVGWGLAVFVLSYALVGVHLDESFVFAIGIIVANIPEGLLPTVTLSLALTVQRMARRNALVRRLSAVETLSAISVICTDKTGTLTKNEMTVTDAWTRRATATVTGTGYVPDGAVVTEAAGQQLLALDLLLAAAALCSNARLLPAEGAALPPPADGGNAGASAGGAPVDRTPAGVPSPSAPLTRAGAPAAPASPRIAGDPTEAALLVAAAKGGISVDALGRGSVRRREIPFSAERRMMSVVLSWRSQELWLTGAPYLVFTKGAPAEVLSRCVSILDHGEAAPLDDAAREAVTAANAELGGRGLRVLGVAMREGGDKLLEQAPADLEAGLTFLGLIAMHDPPRQEVPAAIAACRAAGIRVTMVTGDDGHTAAAVGRLIGLEAPDVEPTVVTGARLSQLSEDELREIIRDRDGLIFARTSPEQKLRIVCAYKDLGHLVAATGDGVNDAPALRAANVGIAMGVSGTDVARQAADMVLLDDDFATIVAAIEQGRAVFQNIRKFATYVITSNVAEMMPFIAMIALKIPPALNVMQILSVDLGTDMIPAVALGAEPPEPGLMAQPPRPRNASIIDRGLLLRTYAFLGILESIVSMAAFFLVWAAAGYGLADLQAATQSIIHGTGDPATMQVYISATTACLAGIVAGQVGAVFACRSERVSAFRQGLRTNRLILAGIAFEIAFLLCVVYLPPLQTIMRTASLPPWALLAVLVIGPLAVLLPDEARKWIVRARRRRAAGVIA